MKLRSSSNFRKTFGILLVLRSGSTGSRTAVRVYMWPHSFWIAREQAWNAKLKGLSKAAAVWNAFHRKCESQWSDLADSEEIRLRMALFDHREFSPEKSSGTDRDSTTLDLKSRLNLERELVMYRLEPLVFRPDEIQADPNDDEIGMVLTEAEGLLEKEWGGIRL